MSSLRMNVFSYKNNHFDKFLTSKLSSLYLKDELTDVTFVCEGRSFKAHKLILSLWSPYFRDIFVQQGSSQPGAILLLQTRAADFDKILQWIYQGNLTATQEDFESFLKTAESLFIAGLNEIKQMSCEENINLSNDTTSSVVFHQSPAQNTSNNNSNNCSINTSNNNSGRSAKSIVNVPVPVATKQAVVDHHNHQRENTRLSRNSVVPASSNKTRSVENSSYRMSIPEHITLSSSVNGNNYSSTEHLQSNQIASHHRIVLGTSQPTAQKSNVADPVVIVDGFITHNNAEQGINLNDLPISADPMTVYTTYTTGDGVTVPIQTIRSGTTNEDAIIAFNFLDMENRNDNHSGGENGPSFHASAQSSITSSSAVLLPSSTQPSVNVAANPPTVSFVTSAQQHIPAPRKPTSKLLPGRIGKGKVFSGKKRVDGGGRGGVGGRSNNSKGRFAGSKTNDDDEVEIIPEGFIPCPKCGKIVKKTSLRVHIKRTHLDDGVILMCPICNKRISSKGVYYKHMYLHRRKSELSTASNKLSK